MPNSDSIPYPLWEAPPRYGLPIAARIGIAGDFLPGMALEFIDRLAWRQGAENIQSYFHDLDLVILNLESPINVKDLPPEAKAGRGQNISAPIEALEYLSSLQVSVAGIANNHIYDYGIKGAERTIRALLDNDIFPLGANTTLANAPEIYVWNGPGSIRVGVWAAARITNFPATKNTPGTDVVTRKRAAQALDQMYQKNITCAIALLHMGYENTNYPDPSDVITMQMFAREGFDIVAACHSHRISGYSCAAMRHNDRPAFCFYGLGSLASGCIYSELEREGLLLVIDLDSSGSIKNIGIRSIYLDSLGMGSIPSVEVNRRILQRFEKVSAEISEGSYVHLYYQEMSQGILHKLASDVFIAFRKAGPKSIVHKLRRLRMRHIKLILYQLRQLTKNNITHQVK